MSARLRSGVLAGLVLSRILFLATAAGAEWDNTRRQSPRRENPANPGIGKYHRKALPSSVLPQARISGGKDVISLIRLGNSLFVDVKLNHRESARFLLDTGCSEMQISRRLARRLGIDDTDGNSVTAQIAGGHTVNGRVVELTEIRVGQARVSRVKAIVLDAEGPRHYDGLLGMSFLNHFIFKIDSERGKLVLQKRYKK